MFRDDAEDEFISEQRELDFLLDQPLEGACLIAIRKIGIKLFEIGGSSAMGTSLDRVCDRRPDWPRCVSILSGRWNGIVKRRKGERAP
jgi:hypothetical protein